MSRRRNIIPLAAGILAGAILTTTASAAVDYVKARLSEQPIYYNGEQIECRAYVIEEQNYMRLADLCDALGVEAYWDSEACSVYLGKRPTDDTVTIPTDGSRYIPQVGDKIRCDDGTSYEITDVRRWESNMFASGPLPELPTWNGTLELPEPEARHFTMDKDDYLYLRNLYETRRMAITLLTGSGSPTVQTSIPEGVTPKYFWPWRESELTKQLTTRPNVIYSVEAWDVYKNGIYLYTEYDVYIR